MLKDINYPELQQSPQQVGELQLSLGSEWADIFAVTGTTEQAKSAEITLRNPLVYLNDVRLSQLPEEIQDKWANLLILGEEVVKAAGTEDKKWSRSSSSLEKLQSLMFTGNINPEHRISIANVIREASKVFSESVAINPGNTRYYSGNVIGMQGWINRYRQPTE